MKIAICGNYGVFNIGDDAILSGLRSAILGIVPKSEIAIMGHGNLLPLGFRSFCKSIFYKKLWQPLKTIKSCDLFILGGGGLFTDEEGVFVSLFWALHGIIAVFYGKPVLCLGLSFGPIRWWNSWLVKKLLREAKEITVRDKKSQELLEKWDITSSLGSDLALLLDNLFMRHSLARRGDGAIISSEKYIVISLRKFKNNNKNLYKKIARVCDRIVEDYGFKIKLIPFQTGDNFDVAVLNTIFELVSNKNKISVESFITDFEKLISIFHNAEIVIAMRLHAGIFSVISEIPFIPLSYMSKVNDFWREFDGIEVLPLNTLDVDRFLKIFHKIQTNRSKYVDLIKNIKKTLSDRNRINENILNSYLA